MLRTILLPAVLISAVGLPMVYSNFQANARHQGQWPATNAQRPTPPNLIRSGYETAIREPAPVRVGQNLPPIRAGYAAVPQPSTDFAPASRQAPVPAMPPAAMPTTLPNVNVNTNAVAFNQSGVATMPPAFYAGTVIPAGTPDYARAETLTFPGNANGPDLTASPMSFVPVTDFGEIFRFNLQPGWVQQRWDRVSTTPGDNGMQGLRVALVTGTNSWDLHGSLTYYFDDTKQLSRITFRGWTGEPSRLIQLLMSQYQLEAKPTSYAGFYLSRDQKKSGLLMQLPAVIRRDNPVQQMALILELNNPRTKASLSDDFIALIPASQNR